MEKRYEVHCFGTEAQGDAETEVMRRVQRLLKLERHQLISLFQNTDGLVLIRTSNRDKAERMTRALNHAGIRARLHDQQAKKAPVWESWSLEEKSEDEYHAFYCKACTYSERFGLAEDVPAICPRCGVVASKYERVASKKAERERIRRKVLDLQSARAEKAQREEEVQREKALRKEIEKEIRRELGTKHGWARHARQGAAAAVLLAAGAGGAIAWYNTTGSLPVADTPADTTVVQMAPAMLGPGLDTERTLFLAADLLDKLAGDNWQGGLGTGDVPVPIPPMIAPATAAGPGAPSADDGRSAARHAAPPLQAAPASADDGLQRIISAWFRQSSSGAMRVSQQREMLTQLAESGRIGTAIDLAGMSRNPVRRLELLTTIAEVPAMAARPSIRIKAMERLARGAADDPPPGAALLNRLVADSIRTDGERSDDVALRDDLDGLALPPEDAPRLYAAIAAHRARQGDPVSANVWFGDANRAFDRLEAPEARLDVLIDLSRAYALAGETATAEDLAQRVRIGLSALDSQRAGLDRLRGRLIELAADLGQQERLSALLDDPKLSPLQADLLRGELANCLADRGQLLAARGVIASIRHPAVGARARALLSRSHAMYGQTDTAAMLAEAARSRTADLPQALLQVVLSDLGEIDWAMANPKRMPLDQLLATPPELTDRALAVVANNLAWNRATAAALDTAGLIGDAALRGQLILRLRVLDQAFAGLTADRRFAALH